MTKITNADHVLLLLRSHLERMQKSRGKRSRPAAPERRSAQPDAVQRLGQIAAAEDLSEREIKKALLAGLLSEELGEAVANDPQFHKMVDDIHAILERDPDASQLLAAAHAQLVKPSR